MKKPFDEPSMFKAIVEASSEAAAVSDPEGNLVYINPAHEKLFGRSPEQARGANYRDYYPPESIYILNEEVAPALRRGASWEGVLDALDADGRRFPLWERADAVRDKDGNLLFAFGVMHDVTAARESEARYRTLFEQNRNPVAVINLEGRYLDANPAFLEFTNKTREALLKMHVFEFSPPDAKPQQEDIHTRIWETGGVLETEYFIDGEIKVLELSISPIQYGGADAVIGAGRDVTAQKRAEAALRESEARYRNLVETITDWVWSIDVSGVHTFSNAAVEKLLGYAVAEITDRSAFALMHPYDAPRAKKVFQEAVKLKKGWRGLEISWVCKDGAIRYFESHAHPEFNEAGDLIGFSGVDRDVTDRKRAEEEKARLEARFHQMQKAESLGRMAGAIAHRFNNKLAAVTGNLEMALEDIPRGLGADAFRENLTEALHAAWEASDVSGMLLAYLGQLPHDREPIDLSALCRRTLPGLAACWAEPVEFMTDLSYPGPVIRGNINQMRQILVNLLTNAAESLIDGRGTVRLSVSVASPADIPDVHRFPVRWTPEDRPYACLEVADDGCGIPAPDIENLFDPFFTTRFTGRGLGLPVVLGIVRAHDGGVTVESRHGGGSVFRLFIPVARERPSDDAVAATLTDRGLTGGKTAMKAPEHRGAILVADDEDMVRKVAAAMLARLGFQTLTARNGAEAVDIFRKNAADIRLVLTDLSMPGMNGWETLAAIRRIRPEVPVILASGYDEARVLSEKQAEHPSAILKKPYMRKDLEDAVTRVLRG